MAYINQEKKKEIVANIKKEFPAKDGWKFSFGVENYSTLYCRLLSAPIDFSEYYTLSEYEIDPSVKEKSIHNPNSYEVERKFKGTESHDKLVRIFEILNETNHDNSDAMTDYFDVGYYVNFSIGYKNWKTDKFTPFEFAGEVEKEVVEIESTEIIKEVEGVSKLELTNSLIVKSFDGANVESPAEAFKSIKNIPNIQWDRENFFLIMLDGSGKVINSSIEFIGTRDRTVVDAGLLLKRLILNDVVSCIIAHNHPRNAPLTPSKADLSLTIKLVDTFNLVGVTLFDHLIINEENYSSLKSEGEM